METLPLFRDLVIAFLTALAGGMLANRLRQPAILGYLVGGVVVGPHVLGLLSDPAQIEKLAQIGVVMLMFALGIEFNLGILRPVWKVAVGAGLLQLTLTIALVTLGAQIMGLGFGPGLLLGFILALSSTVVVVRILSERGELDAHYGRVLLGILIVQDLSVIAMVLLVPQIAGDGGLGWEAFWHLAAAIAFLAASLFFGTRIVPFLMRRVSFTGQRELFLLSVVAIALGMAALSQALGVSLALGAFFAGLVVSESETSQQVLAQVLPLRDLFATLFFVSLGMLIDPHLIAAHAGIVVALVLAILLGKSLIGLFSTWAFGNGGRTALGVGLGLAQIGEFSFILAQLGRQEGILPPGVFAAILGASMISLLCAPFLFQLNAIVGTAASRSPRLCRWMEGPGLAPESAVSACRDHAVICGFGRMGHHVGDILATWRIPFVVVDMDLHAIQEVRGMGAVAIYGDASNPDVLEMANLEEARAMIIALPDPLSSELCMMYALSRNPELEVVVRVHRTGDIDRFYELGATEVVQPEFEASLEAVRRTLTIFGHRSSQLHSYLHQIRSRRYYSFRATEWEPEAALAPTEPIEISWVTVRRGSAAAGMTVAEVERSGRGGLTILAIDRGGRILRQPASGSHLLTGDFVLALAKAGRLEAFESLLSHPAERLADGP